MVKFAFTLLVFAAILVAVTVLLGHFTSLNIIICAAIGFVCALWGGSKAS